MKTVRATRGDFVRDIEVWSDDIGVRLASFDGPAASYQAPEDLLYVRARAVELDDDGNPRFFADPNGHSGVQRNVVVQGNAAYGSGSGFITNPSGCVAKYGNPMYNATDAEIGTFRKGGKQIIDGLVIFAGFHTIFAPNGVSCADSFRENYTWRPLYYGWVTTPSASSYHSGGVNCGMGDGSVRFISDTIDVGDMSKGCVTSGESPNGVWGAMGSRSGGETASSL